MDNRFLDVHLVVKEMSRQTWHHLKELTLLKTFILSVMAGAFITFGALFSVLVSAGVETTGLALLLQGFGFSVGFFMVILSGALLFSETNVVLPASLLNCSTKELLLGAFKFWGITVVGNVIGAFLVGWWINYAHEYPQDVADTLAHIIHKKMHYYRGGDLQYWMQAVVSGMFGNWLVGMAAIFAIMGYFSLIMPTGNGPGWENAIFWNLIPAAIGNILGGILLVALPFWYALTPSEKNKIRNTRGSQRDHQKNKGNGNN